MALQYYPGGLNRTYGHPIVTGTPLLHSAGKIWWVSSAYTGTPSGVDERLPYTSISNAHAAASDGDIIVCLDGHTETVSSGDLTLDKNIIICGSGRTDDEPNCSFDFVATGEVILSGVGSILSNFRFNVRPAAAGGDRLSLQGTANEVSDCYFDCGPNDKGIAIDGGTHHRIERCVFVSGGTGTGAGERPDNAVNASAAVNYLTVRDCTFDSGVYGWDTVYALDFYNLQLTGGKFINNSQLRGADFRVGTADPLQTFFVGGTKTGGALIRTY